MEDVRNKESTVLNSFSKEFCNSVQDKLKNIPCIVEKRGYNEEHFLYVPNGAYCIIYFDNFCSQGQLSAQSMLHL